MFRWDWFITLPVCPPLSPLSSSDHSLQIERVCWSVILSDIFYFFIFLGGCLRCGERGRRLMGTVICMLMCVQGFSWSDWFMGWEMALCGGQEGLRYTNLPVEHLSHNIKVSFIILYSKEMTQYVWKSIANQTKTKQRKLFLFSKIFRDQFKIHILQLLVAPQFPVCVVLWDNGALPANPKIKQINFFPKEHICS